MNVCPMLDKELSVVVSALTLLTRQFTEVTKATSNTIARIADAVPFFLNSIFKAKDCIIVAPVNLIFRLFRWLERSR